MTLLRMLRGFDLLFLAYLAPVSFLLALYRERIPPSTHLLAQNLLMLLFWAGFVAVGEAHRKGVAWFLRNWYLCAGLPLIFTELQFVIHHVRPVDLDPLLARLDYRIFGCHPTVWMERFLHPWLTSVLQVCYVSYFFLVLPIAVYLYLRDREAFAHLATAVAMMFLLTFAGYLLVPAIGPRYELTALQTLPLQGIPATDAMIAWVNRAEGTCRDCFPSGHVAMVVLLAVFSYRTCRFLVPFYAATGAGILLGTVYLRYHYVVDIPAGILLAVFCVRAGPRFYQWWEDVVSGEAVLSPVSVSLPETTQ